MQFIPLQAIPNQTLQVVLSGQACTINVYAKSTGVFADLLVNDAAIVTGQQCVNQVPIVRRKYLGFSGDIAFLDTQGDEDPQYTGFGDLTTRWQLLYLTPADLN